MLANVDPGGHEPAEQAGELDALGLAELGEGRVDGRPTAIVRIGEERSPGVGDDEDAASRVVGVGFAAHVVRVDRRSGETARAGLIDADEVGELAH